MCSFNNRRVFLLITFFLVFGVSSFANAADFYWYNGNTNPNKYPSPAANCQALWDIYHGDWSDSSYTVELITETKFSCKFKGGSAANPSNYNFEISRAGTQCQLGTEYNSATGECLAPENSCTALAGTYDRFSKAGTAPDSFVNIASNGYAIPQRQGCKGGCAAEITDIRGKTRVSGEYLYTGSMTYTGDQCSVTGSGDEFAADEGQNVEPQVLKEDVPCVYSASGDSQVCQSVKSEEIEGRSCGTVNGVETCVPTVPSKNGIDITTEVTTQTLEDGTTVTTKKDTATVTKCDGINNCTSTTATTTTTSRTDAYGTTTATETACTGDACASSGNPDSDGDGVGDCIGDDCGAGGGGEGQDWYTPTGDTFGSVLTEFVGKVQQTPIASQTTSFLTFRASGSCPRWSVSAWVFDIDIDQLCNGDIPWGAIKAVILAAAGFFAFRIALL